MQYRQSSYGDFAVKVQFLVSRLRLRIPPIGCTFLLITTIAYLHHISFFSPPPQTHTNSQPAKPQQTPLLIAQARENWLNKVNLQSQTLEEAAGEYYRRYGLEPPHGFDVWFSYAKRQNVVLVDEYDEMMDAVLPFLKMGSKEARRRSDLLLAERQRANRMLVGGMRDEREDYIRAAPGEEEDKLRTDKLVEMLKPVMGLIEELKWPEWSVMVSEVPEPRVLNSYGDVKKGETIWELSLPGDRRLIESIKRTCGPDSRFGKEVDGYKFEFGFDELYERWIKEENMKKSAKTKSQWPTKGRLVDVDDEMDICKYPELIQYHGLFRTNFNTTKLLVPLLSYGRPSTYGDIPIPSSYQWDSLPNYLYNATLDLAWASKSPTIYWHGEPSGGGKGDEFFGSMHRHRLVALSNPFPPPWNHRTSSLHHYTNVTFSELSPTHCVLFSCNHLPPTLPFTARTPFSTSWAHKLLLDVDGWGPSGRFRALISSNSLPVRSTIYHEWFSGRMVPWWHYVPLSVGFTRDELGSVVRAFLGDGEGEHWGGLLAENGKEWAARNMRKVDMTVWGFRLMLELNRVFNGEEWSYKAADKEEM